MTVEAEILFYRCRLEALITQREGMIAENAQRERRDLAQAYGEEAFSDLSQSMEAISDCVERIS